MKTDHDLLDELVRRLLDSTGAAPGAVNSEMLQMKLLLQEMKLRPARPLSDADYARQLEQMKKELPAFAAHLLKLPVQKPRHHGQNN